ncbi:malate dehydrogenase, glyoxysomal-like [Musa acuminata AAA Group]|uniref:malate dehydrogenase, glyoxysomal-like n=1 Tax=Musa acuminata AAA Group TaxID=214697 RepID=UPI0031D0B7F4
MNTGAVEWALPLPLPVNPWKTGITMDDLFDINAVIVQAFCDGNAKRCLKAKVNLVADSPNSAVPIPPEDYKTAGLGQRSRER